MFPVLILAISSMRAHAGDQLHPVLSLVPEPVSVKELPGKFVVGPGTSLAVDQAAPAFRDVARFLAARLRESTGFPLPLDTAATN